MEDTKRFRNQILANTGKDVDGIYEGKTLTKKEAEEFVFKYLQEVKKTQIAKENADDEKNNDQKDKEYLRQKRADFRRYVREFINREKFVVAGYQDNMEEFIDEMVEESVGYSVLASAMADPTVSDIFVISWDKIYVEQDGENRKYPFTFRSEEHFETTLSRLLQESGLSINSGDKKIVDFELFGDRGCAVHKAISPNGTSLTLRKHSEDHITRQDLIDGGVLTEQIADFLGMLIQGETNLICAGLTGSGKTTTLRALLDYYVPLVNKRMLVCEDTQELFPYNDHTLELVTFKHEEKSVRVELQDLILTALRQKPKYIIVGEVRGVEAEAAVEAMETGHSTMFTMHGGHVWNVINRLVTKYITSMSSLDKDVVERIIGSAVDYVFIQSNIPGIGRKITTVTEIGYNYEENRITTKPIFQFDQKELRWKIVGKIHPEKADKMAERGISYEKLEPWIDKELIKEEIELDI